MGVNKQIPLCVDCDGTLLATDLLHEACFLLLKQFPIGLLYLPFWLLKGKAHLKARLAQHVVFNWSTLPYRPQILELIHQARKDGRHIVLATASPIEWANGIADYLNIFDEVLATEHHINLAGKNKAQALINKFGDKNYDYVGDSTADIAVWQRANGAIVITKNKSLQKAMRLETNLIQLIPLPSTSFLTYVKALRVHQWLKNALVFAPLLAAHQITNFPVLMQAGFAFIAFSACASSVYVLNDLLDLESDRQHIRKRNRPFASCKISILYGALLVPLLLAVSLVISIIFLPLNFLMVLGVYFAMTLAYSIRLKRQVIVDVIMLGGLYTMRIVAGAAATAITPSFWLLAFSMFIFLSLAMVKRYSELSISLQQNKVDAAGRGYMVNDLPVLMAIGVSSSMVSVLVFSLYINLPETNLIYPNTVWLWAIPPILLYWNSRVWMKAHRGEVDDDPIVFAIKDWQSIIILVTTFFLLLLASQIK